MRKCFYGVLGGLLFVNAGAASTDILYIGDSLSVGVEEHQDKYLGPYFFNYFSKKGKDLQFHAFGGSRPGDWAWKSLGRESAPSLYSHRYRVETPKGDLPRTEKFSGPVQMTEEVDIEHLFVKHQPEWIVVQQGTNFINSLRQRSSNKLIQNPEDLESVRQEIKRQVRDFLFFSGVSRSDEELEEFRKSKKLKQIRRPKCYWILPPHARESNEVYVQKGRRKTSFGYSSELQAELKRLIMESIKSYCQVFDSHSLAWLKMPSKAEDPENYQVDALHYKEPLSTRWGRAVSEDFERRLIVHENEASFVSSDQGGATVKHSDP